jgi:hypothetical protein
MRILRMLLLSFTCAAAAYAQTPAPTGTSGSTSAPATGTAGQSPSSKTAAVSGTLILKTSLSSKNAPEGKEVKAALKQTVVLPGGEALPKGTLLYGRVAQASSHSKAKPNGVLLLVFDEARPKGAAPVPVLVKIKELAPGPVVAEGGGGMGKRGGKGGTSNSAAAYKPNPEPDDPASAHSDFKQSGIDNVYLQNSAGGSGALVSPGDDVYLDDDVEMTVLIGKAPPKPE